MILRNRLGRSVCPALGRLGLGLLLGLGLTLCPARAADPVSPPPADIDWLDAFIRQAESSGTTNGAPNYTLVWKRGGVKLVRAGTETEENAEPAPGEKLVELEPRDRLRTPAAAQAILLQIREATALWQQTEVRVTEDNHLYLVKGRFYTKSLGSSRNQPPVQIETPAGLVTPQGTEFQLEVDPATGETRLWLSDGRVLLSNANGTHTLDAPPVAGDPAKADFAVGVMKAGEMPRSEPPAVATFNHIIQWVLYYPAILDLAELPPGLDADPSLAASLAAYRRGDLQSAWDRYPHPMDGPARSEADTLYRLALLTAFGHIDEAERLIAPWRSGTGDGNAARLARAFDRLIAAVRHDHLPEWATDDGLQLRTEWLAQSYYLQSANGVRDNIERALQAARHATGPAGSPPFGFALGRVAELEFSRGHRAAAEAALREARQPGASPDNPQLLVLEGYLHAAAGRLKEALASFKQAVARDGRLGDAWLGLGLCLIRQGQTEAGLKCLQTAVAREPQRATLKSYLAKGYDLNRQPDAALKELTSAKRTDPADPTPWLYSALVKRDQNRINDAIGDLEESKRLNDNRYLFRSRALLDQDRAVRSANLAGLYRDAGMTDVSVREATAAVTSDYGNASAHLFLANSYDALRDPRQITLRYETPWLNELLIAQLMQPVGGGSLSQTVSQQEYSRLFQQNGVGLFSLTQYSSQGDFIESASQYGSFGNTDYAVDVFYDRLDGVRANDDFRGLTVWGKIKQQLTPQDTVLIEANYYDADGGDNRQLYQPGQALTQWRYDEQQKPTLILGYHHDWNPENQTLFLAGWVHGDYHATDPNTDTNALQLLFLRLNNGDPLPGYDAIPFNRTLAYQNSADLFTSELQHIWKLEDFTTVAGVRYQYGTLETQSLLTDASGLPFFPPIIYGDVLADQSIDSNFQRISAYAYEHWNATDWLALVGGIAYDQVHFPQNHRASPINDVEESKDQVSPKAGFILTPLRDTTLRASYTRSLGGLSYDQSFRLEPTQVAGFVQSYRSVIPESVVGSLPVPEFQTAGVLLDHRFPTRTYAAVGVDWIKSSTRQVAGAFDSYFAQPIVPTSVANDIDYEERDLTLTVNQLLGSCWSVGLSYRYSQSELDQSFDTPLLASGTAEATLHAVDGFVLMNLPWGGFAEAQARWRSQSNGGTDASLTGDSFLQLNLFAGYRFLHRRAEVRVGVMNLTDQDYRLNPLNFYQELPRERTFYAALKLDF